MITKRAKEVWPEETMRKPKEDIYNIHFMKSVSKRMMIYIHTLSLHELLHEVYPYFTQDHEV